MLDYYYSCSIRTLDENSSAGREHTRVIGDKIPHITTVTMDNM